MPLAIALALLQAAVQASPPPRSGGMVSHSAPPPVVVTNVAPPPDILYVAPPAPPPIPATRDLQPPQPVLLDVRVSAEGGLIWQGSLRVGPSASYSENRSESRAAPCSTYLGYEQALRSSLSLNLSHYASREKPDQFGVTVSWSRPADPKGCGEPGSRSVQLQQVIEIPPGGEGVVRGDGGLAVHLRRR